MIIMTAKAIMYTYPLTTIIKHCYEQYALHKLNTHKNIKKKLRDLMNRSWKVTSLLSSNVHQIRIIHCSEYHKQNTNSPRFGYIDMAMFLLNTS